jgi:DNA-binding NarL/FixJ family response regulator
MTSVDTPVLNSPSRVRIAITSPAILAQIRQVLAGKNLAVEFVHQPYVEVTVMPTAAASLPRQRTAPTPHRLVAEYRLDVVEVGDRHDLVTGLTTSEPADFRADPAGALSARQRDVMALVSAGMGNREIAARLRVSEKTVKNHINRIFRVLGAANRVEAVLIWQRHQQSGATGRGAPRPPLTLVAGRRPASRPPASAGTP